MKFSHAITGFWLDKRIDFSKRTESKYQYVFNRFIEIIGDKEVESITTVDVRLFMNALYTQHEGTERKQLSKHTLHTYWAVLSSFWTWAEQELEIANVIRGKVKAPKFNEKPIDPYSQTEIKRLVSGAKWAKVWAQKINKFVKGKRPTADRDVAIILTLLDTGLRASELCDLTIADYDQRRGRLHVQHGKGDKARYVILGNRAQKAIWRYLISRPSAKTEDFLFVAKTNNRLNLDNLRHCIQVIAEREGVTNAFLHRFRHTFAIQFLRNGGNVRQLQELMGHTTLEQTMRYVRFVESDIESSGKYSPADNWKL